MFAWRLADKGSSGAPAADTITDFTYGGGYSNVESGTAGVAAGGGDVLDLRELLQGEHTSSGVQNPTTASVEISNLQNYIHVEISGTGSTAITAGDDTNLLKMLIKMGTLRVD